MARRQPVGTLKGMASTGLIRKEAVQTHLILGLHGMVGHCLDGDGPGRLRLAYSL
jgi:hypothetical protein